MPSIVSSQQTNTLKTRCSEDHNRYGFLCVCVRVAGRRAPDIKGMRRARGVALVRRRTGLPAFKTGFLKAVISPVGPQRERETPSTPGVRSDVLGGVLCLVNPSLSPTGIILYTSQKDVNCVSGENNDTECSTSSWTFSSIEFGKKSDKRQIVLFLK